MANSFTLQQRQGFIGAVKKLATKIKKQSDNTHSEILDWIAVRFGFNNWSLFQNHIPISSNQHFAEMQAKFENMKSSVFAALQSAESDSIEEVDDSFGKEVMESWVRRKFTPLVDFAYYDPESENGYAWDSEDIFQELMDRFDGTYSESLIQEVAANLEVNHGPWGRESDTSKDLLQHKFKVGDKIQKFDEPSKVARVTYVDIRTRDYYLEGPEGPEANEEKLSIDYVDRRFVYGEETFDLLYDQATMPEDDPYFDEDGYPTFIEDRM